MIDNNNPALFSSAPVINASGVIEFTSAPDANGIAWITFELQDNGGTLYGGQDTSGSEVVILWITEVNDAPSFIAGPDIATDEDSPAVSIPTWASSISPGPINEATQQLSFGITEIVGDIVFDASPTISPTGTLDFSVAQNSNGTATVTVILFDDGGTANGGINSSTPVSFNITVGPVNEAPSFIAGPDIVVEEDAGFTSIPAWATSISSGPANETLQSVTFVVTDLLGDLVFAASPTISATGTLAFHAAPDANGTASVTVVLVDDGGTANGGIDSSSPAQFTISVNPINDSPTIDLIPNISVLEDATPITVALTGISDGDPEVVQSILITSATKVGLVSSAISYGGSEPTGSLILSLFPDANGEEIVSVTVFDDGAALFPNEFFITQDVIVNITPVNDAPSFVPGGDQSILNDGGIVVTVPGWASSISAGPTDESTQALSFSLDDPSGILSNISINASGELTYTVAPGSHGIVDVSVALNDDGGSQFGGIPSSATSMFRINVFLPFLWGDLDANDIAGAVDASLLLRWDAMLIDEFPGYPVADFPEYFRDDPFAFPPAADVDNSGFAGAFDASLVLRKFVFLIDRFPADSNGDGIGPDPFFYAQTVSNPDPRMLEVFVEAMPASDDGNFSWALTFILDDAADVSGLRIGLTFDPTEATVVEDTAEWLIPGGLLVANNTQPGQFIMSGALVEPLNEGRQELVRVEFEGTSAEPPMGGVLLTVDEDLTRINDGQVSLASYSLQEFSLGLETPVQSWMIHE